MRLQAMAKVIVGAVMVAALGVPGSAAAQTKTAAHSKADTVLTSADLAKVFPPTVYYAGQSAPVQMRNTGGVKFAGATSCWPAWWTRAATQTALRRSTRAI